MSEIRVGNIVELTHHESWKGTRVLVRKVPGTDRSPLGTALGTVLSHGPRMTAYDQAGWPVGGGVRFSARACRVLGRNGFGEWYRSHS